MSKLSEVLKFNDKQTIPSVEGVVKVVKAPKPEDELSPAQRQKNIWPQFVVIEDDGVELPIQIIKKEFHLEPSIKGHRIRISAGNNDGKPCGLMASSYNGKVTAIVSGGADITDLEMNKPKEERQAAPQPVQRSQAKPAQPLNDYVDILAGLFNAFYDRINVESGSVRADIASRLAASVFIQGDKSGLLKTAPTPQATQSPSPQQAEQTIDRYAKLVFDCKISPKNEEGKKLAEIIDTGLFSYKELSDKVRDMVPSVKDAYDSEMAKIKAQLLKRGESGDKCYEICMMDFEEFKSRYNDDIPY